MPASDKVPVPKVNNEPEPVVVKRVPLVGNVTLVEPVVVSVKAFAPLVVNELAVDIFPPRVIVFEPLLTPVPP